MDREQRARMMREMAKEYLASTNAEPTIDQVYSKQYVPRSAQGNNDNTLEMMRERKVMEEVQRRKQQVSGDAAGNQQQELKSEEDENEILENEESKQEDEESRVKRKREWADDIVSQYPGWERFESKANPDSQTMMFRHVSTGCVRQRIPKSLNLDGCHYANTLTPGLPKHWKLLKDPFDLGSDNSVQDSDALYYWNTVTNEVQRERPRLDENEDEEVHGDVGKESTQGQTQELNVKKIEMISSAPLVGLGMQIKPAAKKRKLLPS